MLARDDDHNPIDGACFRFLPGRQVAPTNWRPASILTVSEFSLLRDAGAAALKLGTNFTTYSDRLDPNQKAIDYRGIIWEQHCRYQPNTNLNSLEADRIKVLARSAGYCLADITSRRAAIAALSRQTDLEHGVAITAIPPSLERVALRCQQEKLWSTHRDTMLSLTQGVHITTTTEVVTFLKLHLGRIINPSEPRINPQPRSIQENRAADYLTAIEAHFGPIPETDKHVLLELIAAAVATPRDELTVAHNQPSSPTKSRANQGEMLQEALSAISGGFLVSIAAMTNDRRGIRPEDPNTVTNFTIGFTGISSFNPIPFLVGREIVRDARFGPEALYHAGFIAVPLLRQATFTPSRETEVPQAPEGNTHSWQLQLAENTQLRGLLLDDFPDYFAPTDGTAFTPGSDAMSYRETTGFWQQAVLLAGVLTNCTPLAFSRTARNQLPPGGDCYRDAQFSISRDSGLMTFSGAAVDPFGNPGVLRVELDQVTEINRLKPY